MGALLLWWRQLGSFLSRSDKSRLLINFLAFGIYFDIAVSLLGIYNLPLVLPILSRHSKRAPEWAPFCYGGDSWDRTNDLMHVKHAL